MTRWVISSLTDAHGALTVTDMRAHALSDLEPNAEADGEPGHRNKPSEYSSFGVAEVGGVTLAPGTRAKLRPTTAAMAVRAKKVKAT